MRLTLSEPFKTLWHGKDPFVEVERLEGQVYRELEDGGVLEGRGRSGTFIAETDAAAAALARAAELFADRAAAAGAGVEDAVDAVRTAFAHRA